MAKEAILVGIDLGSTSARSIIAEQIQGEQLVRIIGVGAENSLGIRRGSIIDVEEAAKTINNVIEKAERMAGTAVKRAVINIGGCDIDFQNSKGVIAIGRADGEVTEDDVRRVISESQVIPLPANKEIVHVLPRKYRLDDFDDIKDPVGMKGVRLEVDALIIESSATQVKNLSKCVYQAGIEVDDIVLEPLAAAESVLGKKQKELGVVLINIGGGTTSLAVYEEGELLHVAILPIGAGHITNDIAIGLRTSVEVAEKIKLEYGSATTRDINKKEGVDLSQFDSNETDVVSRFHITEIIEARLEEIFNLVQNELRKIGKPGLLPSGAVLVGGGAKMAHITELAKEILGLPVQIGFPQGFGGILDKVDDPTFATVSGLVLWLNDQNNAEFSQGKGKVKIPNFFSKGTGEAVDKMKGWLDKFLP